MKWVVRKGAADLWGSPCFGQPTENFLGINGLKEGRLGPSMLAPGRPLWCIRATVLNSRFDQHCIKRWGKICRCGAQAGKDLQTTGSPPPKDRLSSPPWRHILLKSQDCSFSPPSPRIIASIPYIPSIFSMSIQHWTAIRPLLSHWYHEHYEETYAGASGLKSQGGEAQGSSAPNRMCANRGQD